MHHEPLWMAVFLLSLLALGIYSRVHLGRPLPSITEEYNEQGRRVTKGAFEVWLYDLHPRLWLAWSWTFDVAVGSGLVAAAAWCVKAAFSD